ncbi:uncharacterized protein LOC124953721 isoform X2 [Vespa velutina]|uniref:uncharacterized protein LOC124953721 isoform X2 n=1 Tax=Vespa velutina TaxID=202808 RepID=UPI001FB2E0AE|nr:uncharacterized protein LOC124953721 isoform X2 [Vespa velutina]
MNGDTLHSGQKVRFPANLALVHISPLRIWRRPTTTTTTTTTTTSTSHLQRALQLLFSFPLPPTPPCERDETPRGELCVRLARLCFYRRTTRQKDVEERTVTTNLVRAVAAVSLCCCC